MTNMLMQGFHGRLDVEKRRSEIIPALQRVAPFDEDELHIPMQLAFNEQVPVVISFYEYYRFLDRMIGTVLPEGVGRLILVRVRMPSAIPLPSSLLDDRVAIFHDLEVESGHHCARGTDHLCIDANFKLYPWSSGDNSFSIRWISPSGRMLDQDVMDRMEAVIATLPVEFERFATPVAGEG